MQQSSIVHYTRSFRATDISLGQPAYLEVIDGEPPSHDKLVLLTNNLDYEKVLETLLNSEPDHHPVVIPNNVLMRMSSDLEVYNSSEDKAVILKSEEHLRKIVDWRELPAREVADGHEKKAVSRYAETSSRPDKNVDLRSCLRVACSTIGQKQ